MTLQDKFKDLNNLKDNIRDILREEGIFKFDLYVESSYFREDYDISNCPVSILVVTEDNLSDVGEKLQDISIYHYITTTTPNQVDLYYSGDFSKF